MTVYNINTATTLAPCNDTLSINAEEQKKLINIDRKRRAEAQKRKNRVINITMGLLMSCLSLAAMILDYVLFNQLECVFAFAIPFVLGLCVSVQSGKVFNFQEVKSMSVICKNK